MRPLRAVLAALIAFVTGLCFADDGWWSATGGIEAFGKSHPNIRMVSEDLHIHLNDSRPAEVDVTFVFRNEGPATTVTMAFPEEYQSRMGASLDRFRTWVDGVRTTASRKITKKTDNEDFDSEGRAVWLKRVTFRRGQQRRVRVAYDGSYYGNTSGDLGLQYILKSGASWKGSIGECKITVDYTKLRKMSHPFFELTAAKWTTLRRGVSSATLINYEPREDLYVDLIPGYWNFAINGIALNPRKARGFSGTPYTAGKPSDPRIRTDSVDQFFGGWVKDHNADLVWRDWKNPVCWRFGGPFTVTGNQILKANGQKVRLKRPPVSVLNQPRDRHSTMVYLTDLVAALGGKATFEPIDQRWDIRFTAIPGRSN